MTIWIGSDFHLGHKRLVEVGFRQEGYEQLLMDAWDQTVKEDDIVYLLGDLAFGSQGYWVSRVCSLPGTKILVKGNHDRNRDNWYLNKGFNEVIPFGDVAYLRHQVGENEVGEKYYVNVMLSHVPADINVLTTYDERFMKMSKRLYYEMKKGQCVLNIHGHTHGQAVESPATFDVTPESVGYRLVTLEQIFQMKYLEKD